MLELFLSLSIGTAVPSTSNAQYIRFDKTQRIEVPTKENIMKSIELFSLIHDVSPNELKAISWIESRFNPEAVSNTGDFGLFQINCGIWWKDLGYLNFEHCAETQVSHYQSSIIDAISIIKFYRKRYSQCKGHNLYYCYNGGQGWRLSKNIDRIRYYHDRVLQTYKQLQLKEENG